LFRISNFEFRISGQAENQLVKILLGSGLSRLGNYLPNSGPNNRKPFGRHYIRKPEIITIMLVLGLAIVVILVAQEGLGKVLAALKPAGCNILWVAAYRFVPMAIDAAGWYYQIASRQVPPLVKFVFYRWIAESVNTLLPAAQVGGHMVRALMLARHSVTRTLAGASVAVDVILGLGTQFLFVVLGILLLLFETSKQLNATLLASAVSGGLLMFGGFVLVQHLGFAGILNGIARRFWKNKKLPEWLGGVQQLETEMGRLYADYRRMCVCALLRLLGWIFKSGETYLALLFLGASPTITDALILEAMCIAANSVGFLLPGALGVREGGILAIGGLLGFPAETALALALIKRARELLVGLPGLGALLVFQKDLLLPATGSSQKSSWRS
jgi:putative membrane protein